MPLSEMMVVTACCMLVAYLVCGIPFGLVIASALGGGDIRRQGSGNIGMTNVARSVGGKAAALTLLCDAGKGTLCMLGARWAIATLALGDTGTYGGALSGALMPAGGAMPELACVFAACVLGHIFTPYLGFHGGKGISVGFGAGLGLWWPVGLGMLAVFLAVTVPTRYVSAGSVCAAVSLPIQCALWGMSAAALVPVTLVAVVVIWSHRDNIGRLSRGEERAFSVRHDKAADVGEPPCE